MSKLEVEISGDVKKLKSAINDATGQLKGLAKQGVDAGKKVNRNALSAARGIKGLGNETVNAVPALNEFSRVIQDAPYGIQGVANNITQLTTQFGYLTKKTGSSKAALKAMLGSLTSPAGILLAISAVTTLLVSFGDKLFKTKKNLQDASKSSKDFVSGIRSLERSLADLFLTQDNINQKIEDYIILQKLKASTDAKENESIEKLKKINEQLTEQRNKLASAERLLLSNKIALSKQQNKETERAKGYIKGIKRETQARKESLQEISRLEKEKRNIILESINVLKEYREQREKLNASLQGSVAALETQKKLLENEQRQVSTNSKTWKEYENRIQAVQDKIDAIKKGITPIVVPITTGQPAGLTRVDTGDVGDQLVGLNLAEIIKPIDDAKIQMQMALLEFNHAADQIIRNNIANTFAGIGEAIGNAMTGAANLGQGLAKVLLSTVGNLMVQLGKLAISIGVGLEKIKQALQNPLKSKLAIAAGVGLIALGSAFKAGAAKIGGSMGTGSVAGAGSSSGFSSGTTFGGARPFSGNLTFTIRGMDLVAVLNSANSQNAIIGGNVSVG